MPVGVQDRVGEGVGSLLRHVVPGTRRADVEQSGEVLRPRYSIAP